MSRYHFAPVTQDEAASFWADSPHASVFTCPDVLGHLCRRVDWWMARRGEMPLCLWPVCRPDGETMALPDFSYYVGPMWTPAAVAMPPHRWLAASTAVYEGLIDRLLKQCGRIRASLPLGVTDVRAFDWWNYHAPGQPRFRILPRYTSLIHGLQDRSEADLVAAFRKHRRRRLRHFDRTAPPALTDRWTTAELAALYQRAYTRTADTTAPSSLAPIQRLVDLVNRGFGQVIARRHPEDARLGGAVLLLHGRGVAHVILCVMSDDWRAQGLGALLIRDAIRAARSRGDHLLDFDGGNSPNRGDDNASYGAEPALYFNIELN